MSLRDQIELLRQGDTPVTFLDALRLVRQAPRASAEDLQALLALYDHRGITDGARDVLGDFLKGRARDLAHEHTAADKVLTLADSGKTLRAHRGKTLQLKLDTRTHRGGIWELKPPSEGVTWTPRIDAERRYTLGELTFKDVGRFAIEIVEVLAPPKRSQARSQKPADEDRQFKLDVIVEGSATTMKKG